MPTSTVGTGRDGRRHGFRHLAPLAPGGAERGTLPSGDHALVGADDQPRRGEEQCDAERRLGPLLHARALTQRSGDEDTAEGGRHRPQAEQTHDAQVDGAAAEVHDAADRFHHGRDDEVARDGGQRRNAEEEHEDRGHQRPATHAGHADDRADEEAGNDQQRIQVHTDPR
jgi:hypothetical protein